MEWKRSNDRLVNNESDHLKNLQLIIDEYAFSLYECYHNPNGRNVHNEPWFIEFWNKLENENQYLTNNWEIKTFFDLVLKFDQIRNRIICTNGNMDKHNKI